MESETKYLPELLAEKDSLDPSFTHAMGLLSDGKSLGVTAGCEGDGKCVVDVCR